VAHASTAPARTAIPRVTAAARIQFVGECKQSPHRTTRPHHHSSAHDESLERLGLLVSSPTVFVLPTGAEEDHRTRPNDGAAAMRVPFHQRLS